MSETKGHPAATILAEIAEAAKTNPEPAREFEMKLCDGTWRGFTSMSQLGYFFDKGDVIRRKPRTVRVSGELEEQEVQDAKRIVNANRYGARVDTQWAVNVAHALLGLDGCRP